MSKNRLEIVIFDWAGTTVDYGASHLSRHSLKCSGITE